MIAPPLMLLENGGASSRSKSEQKLSHGAKDSEIIHFRSEHAVESVADLKLLEHGAEAIEKVVRNWMA